MVGKKKNDGSEFDDGSFDDVEDFSDIDYDADSFADDNEFSDVNADDVEYADEDFGDDEWQQEEAEPAAAKGKKKKAYTERKSFLSFNNIVIIGAILVGIVVVMMNVSGEKAERAAANPNQKTAFQSIMSISGVMDGVLSGKSDEKAPTESDLEAREQRTMEEGFLNNPDAVSPPQPNPISPEDTAAQLTPMPRGPEEAPSADTIPQVAEQPAAAIPDNDNAASAVPLQQFGTAPVSGSEEQNMSAQDVLKQAMANREKRMAGEDAADTAESEVPAPPVPLAEAPVEPEPAQNAAVQPEIAARAISSSGEDVSGLENKIDALLSRIDELESELKTIKSEKDSYEEIEQSVSALREDMREIKSRPATTPQSSRRSETAETLREEPAEARQSSPPAKRSAKRVSAEPSTASGQGAAWELRAAQPGRAWVSRPGERDMRGVEVGQSLPGIGTITAITYQNGRWLVQGNQGQIHQ